MLGGPGEQTGWERLDIRKKTRCLEATRWTIFLLSRKSEDSEQLCVPCPAVGFHVISSKTSEKLREGEGTGVKLGMRTIISGKDVDMSCYLVT